MWEAFRVDSEIPESADFARNACHTCPKVHATAPFTVLGSVKGLFILLFQNKKLTNQK